jgi:glycosyltransferase involved in cell wall biosynthesis
MTQVLKDLFQPSNGRLSYDLIHVEHLRGAEYGLWLKRWLTEEGISIPVVWDSVDSISLLFRLASQKSLSLSKRLVTGFELPRTEKFEGKLARVFDGVLTTSESDARELKRLSRAGGGVEKIMVVPNGVDLSYFKPKKEHGRKKHQIVMTGKMSYHANISMAIHFVKEILPRIQAQHPDVKLWIVGKDPSREVQLLSKCAGVTVTGTVADIRPYLWEATVAVAPLTYAVGIQNKVLEAMASRTPVVVSAAAATSLEIKDNREARITRGPDHFAGAVNELLDDPAMRERIASAGREYVERNHDWKQIAERLEAIYDGIITTRR